MFLLLDRQLLDTLLEFLFDRQALLQLVLHVSKSLCSAHCIDLFLHRVDFLLLLFYLLVDTGELMLLELHLVLWV